MRLYDFDILQQIPADSGGGDMLDLLECYQIRAENQDEALADAWARISDLTETTGLTLVLRPPFDVEVEPD